MLDEALRRLARARGWLEVQGPPGASDAAPGEALVAAGFLSEEQRQKLLKVLPQTPFVCQSCRAAVLGSEFSPRGALACPRCGAGEIYPPRAHPSGGDVVSRQSGGGPTATRAAPHAPPPVSWVEAAEPRDAPFGARMLGGYELERELGRGNFGVVYLARRSGLPRRFALKVTDSRFADPVEIERFRREAQVASKLEHRGIVGVFDVGEDDGRHFYAMEYVEGPTLEDHLEAEAPLLPDEAVELLEALVDALHFAHERRVIHRDLKPANVLLEDGRPRVTDFGLARDFTNLNRLTNSGEVVGSPYYMAPEQFRGQEVDARADVYSLGVILYESLTGRWPYEGKNFNELDAAVSRQDAKTPRELNPAVPPALDRICMVALAERPETRYMSAKAFGEDLASFRRGEEPSHASGLMAASGARPLPWMLLVFALVVLGVVAGGAAYLRWKDPTLTPAKPRPTWTLPPSTRPSLLPSLAPSPSPTYGKTLSLEEARAACRQGAPGDVVCPVFLAALEATPADLDLRLETVGVLRRRGRYDEALALLAPLAGRGDRFGLRAKLRQAELSEARGEIDEAKQAYQDLARAVDPGLASLAQAALARLDNVRDAQRLRHARAALASGVEEAAAARELLLASPPEAPRALDLEPALATLRRLEPDDPWIAYAEAQFLAEEGLHEKALARIAKGQALLAPNADLNLLDHSLELCLVLRRVDAALSASERLMEARPTVRTHVRRGLALWQKGSIDWAETSWKARAVKVWRQGQRKDPAQFVHEARRGLHDHLLALVLSLTKSPEALKLWQRYQPGDRLPELRMRIEARAAKASEAGRKPLRDALLGASRLGGYLELLPLFEAARRAAPRDPVVALERARFLIGRECFGEGREAIREARSLGVDERELAFLEADIFWISGKRHLAAPRLEKLVNERTDDRVGHMSLARIRLAHQDYERGILASRAALRAFPDDPESYWLLAQATLPLAEQKGVGRTRDLILESFAHGGGVHVSVLAGFLSVSGITLSLDEYGKPRKTSRREVDTLVAGYERALPVSRGPMLQVAGASFILQLPRNEQKLKKAIAWTRSAKALDDTRGDLLLLEGSLLLKTRAPRERILELWGKALAIEPKLQFPSSILEAFKKRHGPAGLGPFENRRRDD